MNSFDLNQYNKKVVVIKLKQGACSDSDIHGTYIGLLGSMSFIDNSELRRATLEVNKDDKLNVKVNTITFLMLPCVYSFEDTVHNMSYTRDLFLINEPDKITHIAEANPFDGGMSWLNFFENKMVTEEDYHDKLMTNIISEITIIKLDNLNE